MTHERTRLAACALALAISGPARGDGQSCELTSSFRSIAGAVEPIALGGLDALSELRAAHRDLFIRGLLDLAAWCTENELYLERDNLYRQVIEMEPDNLDARKGLRYARNPDGSWKEPAPRAAKNRNDRALAQLSAKRGESLRPYCDALLEAIENAEPGLRKRVLDDVGSIDADNPRLHRLFGDVESGGKWMTPESAAGKEQRARIQALVKSTRANAPNPAATVNTAGPNGPNRKWKCALSTSGVRVLGNVSEAECTQIARACEAAGQVVHDLLDCPIEFAEPFSVYVFATQEDKDAFVAKLTEFTVEGRAFMLSRANAVLDGTDDVLLSDPDPAKRLDAAVRHAIARILGRTFASGDAQGWLADGLGMYWTHELCGSRCTWFTLGSLGKEQAALATKLALPGTNWFDEACKLLQGEKPLVRLETVVTLRVRAMRMEDMVCAHALAAFIAEGHADAVAEVLKRIGAGQPSPAVLQSEFGAPMDELQTRVVRWLRERR